MLGFSDFVGALMGNEPNQVPVSRPDAIEDAALLAELQDRMPTLERGRDWLISVRDQGSLLDRYPDAMRAATPALGVVATRAWLDIVEEPMYSDDLDSDQILRILGAMMVWQIVATERAFNHLGMASQALEGFLWTPLQDAVDVYLRGQDVQESIIPDVHTCYERSRALLDVARSSPATHEDYQQGALTSATMQLTATTDIASMNEALESAWRVMDAATTGALFRAFGEQLHEGKG